MDVLSTDRNDLRKEWCRLASFEKWNGAASAILLSKNGLYYTGVANIAQCYTCLERTILCEIEWITIDCTRLHHPDCPWLSGLTPDNEPIYRNTTVMRQRVIRMHQPRFPEERNVALAAIASCPYDQCDGHMSHDDTRTSNTSAYSYLERSGYFRILQQRKSTKPECPSLASADARRETFADKNVDVKLKDKLVDAGMYSKGAGNMVYCFCCGLGLQTDAADFDPWIDHARWVPTCPYVMAKKSPLYIHCCLEKTVTEVVLGNCN